MVNNPYMMAVDKFCFGNKDKSAVKKYVRDVKAEYYFEKKCFNYNDINN